MGAQGGGVVAGADALRRKRRPGWRRRPGRRRRHHGPHGGGVGGSSTDRDLILGEGIRIGRYGGTDDIWRFFLFFVCAQKFGAVRNFGKFWEEIRHVLWF